MSDLVGRVIPKAIEDEVKTSYLNYAMSVIVSRALPDVRDGLKPVHRRILYAMHEMGLRADRPFKKSGRIVGDVLGKYHPHGDQSIYDALVRLAQDFSMRYTVVNGQGNFGSVDGYPPAAMRYTEAKLTKLAEEMLRDINKETVDYGPNYDDSMQEPLVLPAAIPYLLVNGASGIAVGMATNMAPHNLKEVCRGICAAIDDPDISIEGLMEYIKGPDFPTGGIIHGLGGILESYRSGRGQVTVRSRYEIEEMKNGRESIIISEIPYMVNKAQLIIRIADLVRDKKVEGISDLRDESDREGMRIVIELKRGSDPQVVLNLLFTHTSLQQNFNVNNLALVNGRPKLLNLKDMIQEFIAHRKEVIVRRSRYDLRKAEERAHILEGLKIALENIDEVIRIIKESENVSVAKFRLMETFSLSDVQSQAILDMRLQKITNLETKKIMEELHEVQAQIAYLRDLLANEYKIYGVIRQETEEISLKYGDERKSEINTTELMDIDMEDLIKEENMVVILSNQGYVKRVSTSLYRSQGRGGTGSNSANLRDDDAVTDVFVANTHEYVLIISSKGKVYWVKVYQLPEGTRTSKGKHIRNVLEMDEDEEVKAFVALKEFTEDKFVFMATRLGRIVKISTHQFRNARKKGINGISYRMEEDTIVSAELTNGNDHVVLITANGKALMIHENEVRPMGRNVSGVSGVKLVGEDKLVAAVKTIENEKLIIVSEKGKGKRVEFDEFMPHARATQGQRCFSVSERSGLLVGALSVGEDHNLICVSAQGKTLTTPVSTVSTQGRSAMGVNVINLDDDDILVGLARSLMEDEVEKQNELDFEGKTKSLAAPPEERLDTDEGGPEKQEDLPDYQE